MNNCCYELFLKLYTNYGSYVCKNVSVAHNDVDQKAALWAPECI